MIRVMGEVRQESVRRIASRGWLRRSVKALLHVCGVVRRELGLPLMILVSGVLLQGLAALFPELTERLYTQSVYPYLLVALSWFSRRLGFSVGEVLMWVLLAVALARLVRLCFLLYSRPEERARRTVASVRFAVWSAAALLWTFLFVFGLNYQRPLLFDLLGYEQKSASAAELETLSREIINDVNETYAAAHADGRPVPGVEETKVLLKESYDTVPDLTLLPHGEYAPPKPLLASEVMTRLGLSGVYSPFTGEPNYNADVPDFQMPFTIAHEMAHQRGVARESEANFVAYVVCISSPNPFVRYSGYRNGLGVLSELYKVNPEKARDLIKGLGPGYREDSRRAAIFWAKATGAAAALSQRVNDLYLRANRVKSGAADYRGSTALIIGYYLHETARKKVSETN